MTTLKHQHRYKPMWNNPARLRQYRKLFGDKKDEVDYPVGLCSCGRLQFVNGHAYPIEYFKIVEKENRHVCGFKKKKYWTDLIMK